MDTKKKHSAPPDTAAVASDKKRANSPDPGTAAPAEAGRSTLSREAIVVAALRVVDAEGLDALSMRRLGTELGVDPMAVYHHVPNKAALLDALSADILSSVDSGSGAKGGFLDERLSAVLHSYRTALLAHPGALPLLVRGADIPPHPAGEKLAKVLTASGMSADQADAARGALLGYALGATATGISDEAFDVGVAALIRGLAGAALRTPKKGKSKDKAKKKTDKKGR